MVDALVWVVPLAVALAGVRRARHGLLVLAASLPLFGSPPGGPYLSALDIAGLAAIAVAFVHTRRRPLLSLDLCVLLFLAVSAASLVPPTYSPASWRPSSLWAELLAFPEVQSWTLAYSWRAFANLLIGIGLYMSVKRCFAGRSLAPLGLALGAGVAIAVFLGLAEHIGLFDLGFYRARDTRHYATRLHSLFFHSGWLAEYLLVAGPIGLAALTTRGSRGRLAAGLLGALLLVTLLLTEQRGAWFTALALIGCALLVSLRDASTRRVLLKRGSVFVGVAVIVLLAVALLRPESVKPLAKRLSEATANLSGRPALWRTAAQLAAERPLLGWGLGSFHVTYEARHPPGSPGVVPTHATPHSLPLSLAAERGLLGLGAGVLIAVVAVLGLIRLQRAGDPDERWLVFGLSASGVSVLVYGGVQYMMFLKMMEWLCWMLLGTLAARLAAESPPALSGRPRWPALVLAMLVPVRVVLYDPLQGPGDRSFGFHQPESSAGRDFQWTYGRAARAVTRGGDVLVLPMASGSVRPPDRQLDVVVRYAGRELARLRPASQWRDYRFAIWQGAPEHGLLEIVASDTFRPFRLAPSASSGERSHDIRRLGIAVGTAAWE